MTSGETFAQQPAISGFGVQIGPFLARPALASAVAAVVEEEDVKARAQQRGAEFKTGADIAGIPMANQQDPVRARGILPGRIKPAVQFKAIAGCEGNILECTPEFGPGRNQDPVGMIDLVMFEPAQHG